MLHTITSLKDEKIQLARQLTTLKNRILTKKFLLEGIDAIQWALESGVSIDFIISTEKYSVEIANKIQNYINIFIVGEGLLKKITDTKYLIPVVGVGNIKENESNNEFALVLDNVVDFGNVGTIIRTASAFNINRLFCTNESFDLFQKKTIQASRGKVFSSSLQSFKTPSDTIQYLKNQNYQIISTSPYGNTIQSMVQLDDRPIALIVGNETEGISDEFMNNSDIVLQIPMQSEIESLNVGVATGISIYELKLKQVLGMIKKKIKATLGREINVSTMLIQEALDKELKKVSKFSSKQIVFLMVLKCDVIMTITEIQKQFGLPDKDVNSFLDLLLSEQMIIKKNVAELSLTQKGEDTLSQLWTVIENTEKKILSGFSNDETSQLMSFLKRVNSNCLSIINNPAV